VGATKSSKSSAAPAATKYLQNCNGISTDHKIMHILFVVVVKCKKTSTHPHGHTQSLGNRGWEWIKYIENKMKIFYVHYNGSVWQYLEYKYK